jgi:hypothetical protein
MEITIRMKPTVIGLVAVDGTGKTTLAEEFARNHNKVLHQSVKGPLQDAVAGLLGLYPANTQENKATALSGLSRWGTSADSGTGTLRDLQIDVGNLIEKHFGDDYLMRAFLATREDSPYSAILDDVRTPGQALALKEAGGLLVYLRPREDQVVVDHPLNTIIKDKTQHLCHTSIAVEDISQAIRDLEGVLINFNAGRYEQSAPSSN